MKLCICNLFLVFALFLVTDVTAQWTRCSIPETLNSRYPHQDGSKIRMGSYRGYFESADGGISWQEVTIPIVPAGRTILDLVRFQDYLLAFTYYNIYSSVDSGASWQLFKNKPVSHLNALGSIIFGKTYNAAFRSKDTGATWTNSGCWGGSVIIPDTKTLQYTYLATPQGVVYADCDFYGIAKSVDTALTWTVAGANGIAVSNSFTYVNGRLFSSKHVNLGADKDNIWSASTSSDNNWVKQVNNVSKPFNYLGGYNDTLLGCTQDLPYYSSNANTPQFTWNLMDTTGLFLDTITSFYTIQYVKPYGSKMLIAVKIYGNDPTPFRNLYYYRELSDLFPAPNSVANISKHEQARLKVSNNSAGQLEFKVSTSRDCRGSLMIYDIAGRAQSKVLDITTSGKHCTLTYDASMLPPGMYFVTLVALNQKVTERVVITR